MGSKVISLCGGDRHMGRQTDNILNPLQPQGRKYFSWFFMHGGWETSNPAKFLPFHFMKEYGGLQKVKDWKTYAKWEKNGRRRLVWRNFVSELEKQREKKRDRKRTGCFVRHTKYICIWWRLKDRPRVITAESTKSSILIKALAFFNQMKIVRDWVTSRRPPLCLKNEIEEEINYFDAAMTSDPKYNSCVGRRLKSATYKSLIKFLNLFWVISSHTRSNFQKDVQ